MQDTSLNCPGVSTPMNGSVSYISQRVGHTARYNCSTGYILEGSSSRTCLSGGYWSGHQPYCWGKHRIYTVLLQVRTEINMIVLDINLSSANFSLHCCGGL